jgi:hypothetical protein
MSTPDPQRTVCPVCGRVEPPGADFCECGEYLGWDDPEPSGDDEAPAAPEQAPAEPPEPPTAPPPAERDAASIDLRLPGQEHHPGAAVRLRVKPGESVRLHAMVRNEGRVVDDWTVSVGGLPADWWSVQPETVNLLPVGDRAGFEQEVEIELHPPRAPQAEAREWALEILATPVDRSAATERAPFSLAIAPFHSQETALRPQRSTGRRRGRHTVTVANQGNARLDARLEGADQDGDLRFAFAPPLLDLRPGEERSARMEVRPSRPIVAGRTRELQLQVLTHGGAERPGSANAAFRQRPWVPWWVILVLIVLIAVVAIIVLAG